MLFFFKAIWIGSMKGGTFKKACLLENGSIFVREEESQLSRIPFLDCLYTSSFLFLRYFALGERGF